MSVYFERPIGLEQRQSHFNNREVGLNHPDVPGFIKIADNGDIQIMAGQDIGIILSPSKHCIFLIGDNVKFMTKGEEGLRWNDKVFNPHASVYSESTLLKPEEPFSSLYDDINLYMD